MPGTYPGNRADDSGTGDAEVCLDGSCDDGEGGSDCSSESSLNSLRS